MPDKPITLDICIPVYGRGDLLRKCLASIEATASDIPYRLCIVDDASKDKKEILEALKGVRAIVNWNKTNAGFGQTVNRAVRMGTAPLIAIVNSDTELQPNCLQSLMAEFRNPVVGITSPKLLFPQDSKMGLGETIQHAGMCWNIHAVPIHVHIGWRSDHPRANQRRDDLDCVTGALFMTRRSVWDKIGGFDPIYGKGTFEDCEYVCRVAHEFGMQAVYQPQAVAYHHVGASVLAAGEGYPMSKNRSIFLERMGKYLVWNEWAAW